MLGSHLVEHFAVLEELLETFLVDVPQLGGGALTTAALLAALLAALISSLLSHCE